MQSTHNEEKSADAGKLIRNLKNKLYKYMTSVSKNIYIDKLGDFVNEYNNTCHRTFKMTPANINSCIDIDFNEKRNDKDPKFWVDDHVRIYSKLDGRRFCD